MPAIKYKCLLWKEDGTWTAHHPTLGCFGVGGTRRIAAADLAEAIREMLAYLREIGEKPPADRLVEVGEVEI